MARGLCFYPGTRAWRGPLRRCSLEPDTWAVVPSPFRSAAGRPATNLYAPRACDAQRQRATRPSESRPSVPPRSWHTATTRSLTCEPARRSRSAARVSRPQTGCDTTDSARSLVASAPSSRPTGMLDHLQAIIPGPTHALLVCRVAAGIRRRGKPEQPTDPRGDSGTRATASLRSAAPPRSSSPPL